MVTVAVRAAVSITVTVSPPRSQVHAWVPAGLAVTSTVPPACGGVTAVIWVSGSTVKDAAGIPPNDTPVAPVRWVPAIRTSCRPAAGPCAGVSLVTAGAGAR